jgi:hypothetical protein
MWRVQLSLCSPHLPVAPSTRHPTFSVSAYAPALPLSPLPASVIKPPLPPRPGAPTHASCLPNLFSFFGKGAAPPLPAAAAAAASPAVAEPETVVDVSAFVLDRRVVLKNAGKALTKALRAEAKDMLAATSVLSDAADRAQGFLPRHAPLFRAPRGAGAASLMRPAHKPNAAADDAEALAVAFPDFYAAVEDELHASASPTLLLCWPKQDAGHGRREGAGAARAPAGAQRGPDPRHPGVGQVDRLLASLRQVWIGIWGLGPCLSELLHRLILPPTADDLSHNEALSSWIALPNTTDITLAHLGMKVGPSGREVDSFVMACG